MEFCLPSIYFVFVSYCCCFIACEPNTPLAAKVGRLLWVNRNPPKMSKLFGIGFVLQGLFLGKDQQAPFRDRVRITGL